MFLKNKNATVFVIILFFSVSVLTACGSDIDDKKSVLLAKEHLENNRMRAANLELKNALQANANNAEARYLLGSLYITIGDMASAAKEFRKAEIAGWDEGEVQVAQMRALIQSNRFNDVIEKVEIKKDFSPAVKADLLGLKAYALAAIGKQEQARDLVAEGKEIDANAFQLVKTDIQLNVSRSEFKLADAQLKKSLEKYGDNSDLLLLRAYSALQNDKESVAADSFRRIIAKEPHILVTFNGRRARLGLMRIELLNKNMDEAQKLLEPMLRQNDDDPEANYMGGLLAFELKQYDLAEERLLKVLKLAPEHKKTLLLFGTVNFAQQDFEQAAYYMSKYVQANPKDMGARKLLGRAYIKMGRTEEAREVLQAGIDMNQNDAELIGLVGVSQLKSGDLATGISDLEKAVGKSPESDALRNALAKAYIAAGDTDKALQQLNTIQEKEGNRYQSEVLRVSAYLRAEQYDKAIDAVLELKKESPDNAAIQTLVGSVFVAAKDTDEARKYFKHALQIDPGYLQASLSLAELEEKEGHAEEAKSLYLKMYEKHPKETAPLLALARLAEAQKQDDMMVEWLEKARSIDEDDLTSRKILAVYYMRENQIENATLLVSEAARIAPRDNSVMVMQARLQMTNGQYNKALISLNELVTRVPESVFIRVMLAETYIKLQQPADAQKQLEIVLKKQPYYVPALILQASLELQAEQYDLALNYAEDIQKVQPDLHMGYELAGDALMAKKAYDAARSNYRKALQLHKQGTLAIKLSETSSKQGDYEQATRPLLSWLEDNPDDATVRQFLATAYQNMKQDKKAISTFERVLKIQPDNVLALNNLAWLYSVSGDDRALNLAEKAYQLKSDDAGILDTYGWILVQQEQAEKGRRILGQAIEQLPDVPEVQYHYAVALLKTGDEAQAKRMLRQLLSGSAPFEGRDAAERLLQ